MALWKRHRWVLAAACLSRLRRTTHLTPSRSARIGSSARNMRSATRSLPGFGEVDDVEIEVVVPVAVEARGHVDERSALLAGKEPDQAVVGGVGGDDVVDRLEHRAVEILDLARARLVDRHGRVGERDVRAAVARERDQLAIVVGVSALHQLGVGHRRERAALRLSRCGRANRAPRARSSARRGR